MLPRSSFEEVEIRTKDGAQLRAIIDEPGTEPTKATIVLAHAMFARKSSFGRRDRPGLGAAFVDAGYRTIAFDFRGHGDSIAPGGDAWTYDDLVRVDMPAMVEFASSRGDEPVVVVGHSLGGHVALAAQGTGHLHADAIVGLAANVWLKEFDRSRARWALKSSIARAMLALSERTNGLPARRLRIGSDDASAPYVRELFGGVLAGRWQSADGKEDYRAGLSKVTIPFASVLGERDVLMCNPSSGEAFARACKGPVRFFHVRATHMELATRPHCFPTALRAVEWALGARTR